MAQAAHDTGFLRQFFQQGDAAVGAGVVDKDGLEAFRTAGEGGDDLAHHRLDVVHFVINGNHHGEERGVGAGGSL